MGKVFVNFRMMCAGVVLASWGGLAKTCGLYYKHITIVIDTASVISK
jgi:hypothetical protein